MIFANTCKGNKEQSSTKQNPRSIRLFASSCMCGTRCNKWHKRLECLELADYLLTERPVRWLSGVSADWLTCPLTERPVNWLNYRSDDWTACPLSVHIVRWGNVGSICVLVVVCIISVTCGTESLIWKRGHWFVCHIHIANSTCGVFSILDAFLVDRSRGFDSFIPGPGVLSREVIWCIHCARPLFTCDTLGYVYNLVWCVHL